MPDITAKELAQLIRNGEKNHGKEFMRDWLAKEIVDNPVMYEEIVKLMEKE